MRIELDESKRVIKVFVDEPFEDYHVKKGDALRIEFYGGQLRLTTDDVEGAALRIVMQPGVPPKREGSQACAGWLDCRSAPGGVAIWVQQRDTEGSPIPVRSEKSDYTGIAANSP